MLDVKTLPDIDRDIERAAIPLRDRSGRDPREATTPRECTCPEFCELDHAN